MTRLEESILLDQIEAIRAANNKHWMGIVRLALKHAPGDTKHLLKQIADGDGLVRRLTKEIANG